MDSVEVGFTCEKELESNDFLSTCRLVSLASLSWPLTEATVPPCLCCVAVQAEPESKLAMRQTRVASTPELSTMSQKTETSNHFRFMLATLQLRIPNIVSARFNKLSHQALHGRWGGAPFHGCDLLGRAVRGGASGLGRILNTVHHCVNHCYGR